MENQAKKTGRGLEGLIHSVRNLKRKIKGFKKRQAIKNRGQII
jgi:hypothetical protein